MAATTIKTVKENVIGADAVSLKNGVFTVRRGFFYTGGTTAANLVERVKSAFPAATIIDSGETRKEFKGGASVANQSHWWVKFSL
jgi:hypothetical protein